MKRIGIIGMSGRMGQVLQQEIAQRDDFEVGLGYSKENAADASLEALFAENDLVIDFSNAALVGEVLAAANQHPKPLIICTTGWDQEAHQAALDQFSAKAPLIIASNTSVGAVVQRYLVHKLASVLGDDFDVDLHESHHRFKVDSPSGTAVSLIEEIVDAKATAHQQNYTPYTVGDGARKPHQIGVSVQRAGSIVGEHDVTFTSLAEQIEIRHRSFDRALFAQGALTAAAWLMREEKGPGIYTMFDVLNLH